LSGKLVGLLAIADLADLACATDGVHLLERTLGRAVRQPARDQEVPRVAVGHVDDVARAAERPHLLRQDDLHRDA
jgi:hypothetical protein